MRLLLLCYTLSHTLPIQPQIALNYQRKSTRGFAIAVILLDVAGGLLSFAQLGVDAVIVGSWWAVAGDPGKV